MGWLMHSIVRYTSAYHIPVEEGALSPEECLNIHFVFLCGAVSSTAKSPRAHHVPFRY